MIKPGKMFTAVENWFDKAVAAFERQDYAMTVRYCTKALSLNPSYEAARNLRTTAETFSAVAILSRNLPKYQLENAFC